MRREFCGPVCAGVSGESEMNGSVEEPIRLVRMLVVGGVFRIGRMKVGVGIGICRGLASWICYFVS